MNPYSTESVPASDTVPLINSNWSVHTEKVTFEKSKCGVNDATFDFVFNAVIIGILCIFGLLGNSLSIFVLQKDPHNKVAIFLLQALAVADNVLLLVAFVTLSIWKGLLHFLHNDKEQLGNTMVYIPAVMNPFGAMAQTATVWMTVLLAMNRYLAVCKPFQAYVLCTLKRAKLQVLCVVLFTVCFNFPRLFQYRIKQSYTEEATLNGTWKNVSHLELEGTSIGHHTTFGVVYTNAIYSILVLILPMLMLLVLNTKIILDLRRSRSQRMSIDGSAAASEANISFIMIIIIIVFIVCQTPDRILQIFSVLIFKNTCTITKTRLMCVCNMLVVVNSSTNFVIYFLFRRSFRRILKRRLCLSRYDVDMDKDSQRNSCTSNILMTAISGEDLRCIKSIRAGQHNGITSN